MKARIVKESLFPVKKIRYLNIAEALAANFSGYVQDGLEDAEGPYYTITDKLFTNMNRNVRTLRENGKFE